MLVLAIAGDARGAAQLALSEAVPAPAAGQLSSIRRPTRSAPAITSSSPKSRSARAARSGKGFLKGTQARLNFLPEQTTDFIFAVFAEEFGLAGALLLLALYASVIARGAWIARHARDRFGALLAIGFTAIVFWQVAINIGMATGMLPVVGITLPLVSYGGSSLIAMMAAMGILISINTRRYLF